MKHNSNCLLVCLGGEKIILIFFFSLSLQLSFCSLVAEADVHLAFKYCFVSRILDESNGKVIFQLCLCSEIKSWYPCCSNRYHSSSSNMSPSDWQPVDFKELCTVWSVFIVHSVFCLCWFAVINSCHSLNSVHISEYLVTFLWRKWSVDNTILRCQSNKSETRRRKHKLITKHLQRAELWQGCTIL